MIKQWKSLRQFTTRLFGPAFIAAVAYTDPGNFATNFVAGDTYGYALLWVLVLGNVSASFLQYMSAKLGIVTGKSLPEVVADSLPNWGRRLFWLQAELVAIATDVAEVVGGAVALNLLFNLPLPIGGILVGFVSLLLLGVYRATNQRPFELVILGLTLLIPTGFVAGLIARPVSMEGLVGGLVPSLPDVNALYLTAAMLGATVMPHVVYLHSALTRDRFGSLTGKKLRTALKYTKLEIIIALTLAGAINILMLLVAATMAGAEGGTGHMVTMHDVYGQFERIFGQAVASLFAIGLLASGLASTAVGNQAGSAIIGGMIERDIPLTMRRSLTLIPAMLLLVVIDNPVDVLIFSQVQLSFGIPFAVVALLLATSSKNIMGAAVNRPWVSVIGWMIGGSVLLLNFGLLWVTLTN